MRGVVIHALAMSGGGPDAPTVIEAVGIERVANGYQAMGERRAIKTLLRL